MIDERKIQNWLVDEGIFREKIHDENSNFHFIINHPDDNIMDIIQPKGKDEMLLIGCATEVSPEHLDLIRKSSDSKKEDFLWDIRFSLNSFLLDFDLEHPNNELQRFVITEEIYEDGLTKNSLIHEIKRVFKGKLQCIWLLGKVFGEVDLDQQNDTKDSMFV